MIWVGGSHRPGIFRASWETKIPFEWNSYWGCNSLRQCLPAHLFRGNSAKSLQMENLFQIKHGRLVKKKKDIQQITFWCRFTEFFFCDGVVRNLHQTGCLMLICYMSFPFRFKAALITIFIETKSQMTMCNVRGARCENPTESYDLTLQFPSALWKYLASFSSLV